MRKEIEISYCVNPTSYFLEECVCEDCTCVITCTILENSQISGDQEVF